MLVTNNRTPGALRTPGSYTLYVHYRDRIKQKLAPELIRQIREEMEGVGVSDALSRERSRLELEGRGERPE